MNPSCASNRERTTTIQEQGAMNANELAEGGNSSQSIFNTGWPGIPLAGSLQCLHGPRMHDPNSV
jgi:hypothetical protein